MSIVYNITDAEDVAYGNNTSLLAAGTLRRSIASAGGNGVLGGGDDGAMTHFDRPRWALPIWKDWLQRRYGTLFIISAKATTVSRGDHGNGTLLRAYDLSLMGTAGNIRSDVTYAPGSQNPGVKSIYIASRGVDNDNNANEKMAEYGRSASLAPAIPLADSHSDSRSITDPHKHTHLFRPYL